MLWENVPGAFSSNKGEDFRAVLEKTIRIAEPEAPDIPLPEKGRWPLADAWLGDGWSVAYRVLDAQFWGVPQRRRRIALVADFGGHAATEILFVRKSMSGYFGEGGAPGETSTGGTGGGAEKSSIIREPIAMRQHKFGEYREGVATLTAGTGAKHTGETLVISFTERGRKGGSSCETQKNIMYALTNPGGGGRTNSRQICERGICRRLTPLECERLQGFPDGWTNIGPWMDGKGKRRECKDASRYKALGNSIALPPWAWVLKRICSCYERNATMASLFDGIGGFPLLWERLNGPGSCLWASEIDDFPIAVTKYHFGKEIAIP